MVSYSSRWLNFHWFSLYLLSVPNNSIWNPRLFQANLGGFNEKASVPSLIDERKRFGNVQKKVNLSEIISGEFLTAKFNGRLKVWERVAREPTGMNPTSISTWSCGENGVEWNVRTSWCVCALFSLSSGLTEEIITKYLDLCTSVSWGW